MMLVRVLKRLHSAPDVIIIIIIIIIKPFLISNQKKHYIIESCDFTIFLSIETNKFGFKAPNELLWLDTSLWPHIAEEIMW